MGLNSGAVFPVVLKFMSQNISGVNQNLASVGASANKLQGNLKGLANAWSKVFVAKQAAAFMSEFIGPAAKMQTSMAQLKVWTNLGTESLASFRQEAERIATTTKFMPYELIDSMRQLKLATKDAQGGMEALKTTTQLAMVAPKLGLEGATDLVSEMAEGFNLTGKQAELATQKLFKLTKVVGLRDIGKFQGIVGRLGREGRAFGENSFDEIIMMAGLGLKSKLEPVKIVRAITAAGKANAPMAMAAMRSIGLEIFDPKTGAPKKLTSEIIVGLATRWRELGKARMMPALEAAFKGGAKAITPLLERLTSGGKDPATEIGKISRELGTMNDALGKGSDEMGQTFDSKWAKFVQSLKEAAMTIGESLLPALSGFADTLIAVIKPVSAFLKENPWITSIIGLGGGGLLAGYAALKGIRGISGILGMVGGLAGKGGVAAAAGAAATGGGGLLSGVSGVAGTAALTLGSAALPVAAAVALVSMLAYSAYKTVKTDVDKDLTQSAKDYLKHGGYNETMVKYANLVKQASDPNASGFKRGAAKLELALTGSEYADYLVKDAKELVKLEQEKAAINKDTSLRSIETGKIVLDVAKQTVQAWQMGSQQLQAMNVMTHQAGAYKAPKVNWSTLSGMSGRLHSKGAMGLATKGGIGTVNELSNAQLHIATVMRLLAQSAETGKPLSTTEMGQLQYAAQYGAAAVTDLADQKIIPQSAVALFDKNVTQEVAKFGTKENMIHSAMVLRNRMGVGAGAGQGVLSGWDSKFGAFGPGGYSGYDSLAPKGFFGEEGPQSKSTDGLMGLFQSTPEYGTRGRSMAQKIGPSSAEMMKVVNDPQWTKNATIKVKIVNQQIRMDPMGGRDNPSYSDVG